MNRFFLILTAAIAMMAAAGCNSSELEQNFKNPPEEVQTAVYWYWISGNISKEGVIDDLHAMKRAGINRAFIGDIGQDGFYTENSVKIFSDEWWEVLHTALKTAAELDIEIGIFNSPGWSQSGGPWVKPEQAMRYLASSQTTLTGPQQANIKLDIPTEQFQHVRTIAFPTPATDKVEVKIVPNNIKDLSNLEANEPHQIELQAERATKMRSLTIYPAHRVMLRTAHVDAELNGQWVRIADAKVDRSKADLNVGFTSYAPVTISFPATEASRFRLTLDASSQAGGIERIELSPLPRIASYAEKTLAKMCQTPLPYWDHYMWQAEPALDDKSLAIAPEKVIDITNNVSADGTLSWSVPEGEWTILHTGMTPTGVTNAPATPEATGLEIDKMSAKHVESHFNSFIGEILRRIPEKDRSTFKVVVQDSYETGGQNFTDDMIEKFEQTYGYSMIPYLPTLYGQVVNSPDHSNRFLWDLRRMIANRIAYDYVGGLKKVSNAHGLTTWLECYGHWGFPGEFLQYGGQSDEIGGEFWSAGDLGDIENRAASSCGHIYGKRKIWAESNTSGGPAYSRSPIDMKQRTDRFFTEGINATLLHLYIEQANTDSYPGINAWFGNEFDAHNTWYSHMDLFTTYLKRCNYMLQQGLNIADVAYLIGEDAPKMTGLQHPALPKGYQFDYINAEVLMLGTNVVKGNIMLPHGTSYRVLVLPPIDNMRPDLLEKIKRMVRDGATILGAPPTHSPSLENYPAADASVEQMARELWGECYDKKGMVKYGKGRVFNGYSLEELFAEINLVADCHIPAEAPLLYNHRSSMGAEIYFVSNQANNPVSTELTFRINANMRPELWSAIDGSIKALPEYEVTAQGIKLPLEFDALGSYFIVFRDKVAAPTQEKNFAKAKSSTPITAPWRLTFEGKLSSPEPIQLNNLSNLSQSENNEVKYFSGTINYSSTFHLSNIEGSTVVDFDKVECMAKVYVNGKYAGGTWCEPFKVDISDQIIEGENQIRVEVVNKWVNRIVGDMQLPASERKISLTANPYTATSALPASGIIGDVKIEQY